MLPTHVFHEAGLYPAYVIAASVELGKITLGSMRVKNLYILLLNKVTNGSKKYLVTQPHLLGILPAELSFKKFILFILKSLETSSNSPDESYECQLGEDLRFSCGSQTNDIQGDHSGCSLSLDIKTKVAF